MYTLFVTIKVKPEYRDQFRVATIRGARASTKNEPGCLRYDVYQNSSSPDTFHLLEIYESEQAHRDIHMQSPHFLQWQKQTKSWFDGNVEVVQMVPINQQVD